MKQLINLVYIFLGFVSVYHLISVGGVFGSGIVDAFSLALSRDLMWILFILTVCFGAGKKRIVKFLELWGYECGIVGVLIVRSFGLSYVLGRSFSDMIIGYKYDIHFLVIALSAVCLGTIGLKDKQKYVKQIVSYSRTGMCFLLVGGLIYQLVKMGFPEFFTHLGYGPIGDYAVGSHPPLWYRTGPGGRARLQGFFSGPNNFGYFLVGIFSFFLVQWWQRWQQKEFSKSALVLVALVYMGSLIWTLSRGALVGVLVQIMILTVFSVKRLLVSRTSILWGVGIVTLLILGGFGILTYIKPSSTVLHMLSWQEGWIAFMNSPLGYGLGMAGPSVHHQGVYLPENQYLQMLLDIGVIGMLFWLVARKILLSPALSHLRDDMTLQQLPHFTLLALGIIGLMSEGLFLHVWEDSMVNYLILVPFGILLGMSREKPFLSKM